MSTAPSPSRTALLVLSALGLLSGPSIGQDGPSGTAGAVRAEDRSGRGAAAATSPASSRDPARVVRVAVVQAGEKHFAGGNPGPEANFSVLAGQARQAAASRPRPELICFPEYALSGWPYPEEEVINGLAEAVPGDGPWCRAYRELARETGTALLASLVELDDGRRYNTACLFDARGGFRGKYRKVHATLGEQGWWGWSKGRRFELLELDGVKYGVSICADMWFPETVRCQELLGADVVLHQSIGDDMGRVVPTRALDSGLPIVMAIFQGGSYAVDAEGNPLGKLPADRPGWTVFELRAFRSHLGRKFGGLFDERKTVHNMRNPGAYSILVDPSTRPPWTEVFMDDRGRPQTRQQIRNRFQGHYDDMDPEASRTPAGGAASRPG
jgi:predicted amidohydrolase